MSFHHDPDQWLRWADEAHCPYCCKEPDPMDAAIISTFRYSELCAHPQVALKGTCYLISRRHYVRLYDLPPEALLGFMQEAQAAARALQEITGAFHINYEIHGNSAPHLHLHLFPRYLDDPFPGQPIDYHRIDPPAYAPGEFAAFVEQMCRRLAENHPSVREVSNQQPVAGTDL